MLTDLSGVETFARYAFAPNELGYCGPEDFVELMRGDPRRLAERADEFEGAWAYLATLAEAMGDRPPLHPELVRAYWVGNALLEQVDSEMLLHTLRQAIRGPATGLLGSIEAIDNPPAHHNFHVLAVYPWITLLRIDATTPLSILRNCCIRPGRIESVAGDVVEVSRRELVYDDGRLALGDAAAGPARWRLPGYEMIAEPEVGQHVSLHWDWVCDVLTGAEVRTLNAVTGQVLGIVNRHLRGA